MKDDAIKDFISEWAKAHQDLLKKVGHAFIAVRQSDGELIFSSPDEKEFENFLRDYPQKNTLFVCHTITLSNEFIGNIHFYD